METPIEIEFNYKRDEYLRGMRFQILTANSNWSILFLFLFFVFVGLIAVDFERVPYFSIFVFLFYIFYVIRIAPGSMWKLLYKNKRQSPVQYWRFTQEGIRFETDFFKGDYTWQMFVDMKENDDYFLLVRPPRYRGYNLIPKRAFKSQDEMDAFVELFHQKVKVPKKRRR